MFVLAMMVPVALIVAILATLGPPSDLATVGAASATATVACLWVALVFARRWLLTRHMPRTSEAERLLAWMLLTMTVVALCIATLLFYRAGNFFALAIPSESWSRWFVENRLVGASITLALAVAMVAKLRYPVAKSLGRFWIPVVTTGGVLLFFAFAYLPRLL